MKWSTICVHPFSTMHNTNRKETVVMKSNHYILYFSSSLMGADWSTPTTCFWCRYFFLFFRCASENALLRAYWNDFMALLRISMCWLQSEKKEKKAKSERSSLFAEISLKYRSYTNIRACAGCDTPNEIVNGIVQRVSNIQLLFHFINYGGFSCMYTTHIKFFFQRRNDTPFTYCHGFYYTSIFCWSIYLFDWCIRIWTLASFYIHTQAQRVSRKNTASAVCFLRHFEMQNTNNIFHNEFFIVMWHSIFPSVFCIWNFKIDDKHKYLEKHQSSVCKQKSTNHTHGKITRV